MLALAGIAFGVIMVAWHIWGMHRRHKAALRELDTLYTHAVDLQLRLDAIQARAQRWRSTDQGRWDSVLQIVGVCPECGSSKKYPKDDEAAGCIRHKPECPISRESAIRRFAEENQQ